MSSTALAWIRTRKIEPDALTGIPRPVDEPALVINGGPVARAVLTELCLRAEDFTHRAWASRKRLQQWTQYTKNPVDRAIKDLVAQRLIFVLPSWKSKDGSRSTNVIVLNVNGEFDRFDSLESIATEVERRAQSMSADDAADRLAGRRINPALGTFVPVPSEGTPPSPLRGGPLPSEGTPPPLRGDTNKEGVKELDQHHPPQPPVPDTNAPASQERAEEVGDASGMTPSAAQTPVKPPQDAVETPKPLSGSADDQRDVSVVPEGREPGLWNTAVMWVRSDLVDKTPDAVALTLPQEAQVAEDVYELLAKGWTMDAIDKRIGRLSGLKFRFKPIRDKLAALAVQKPLVPKPRARTDRAKELDMPRIDPNDPVVVAARRAARDHVDAVLGGKKRKATP